jgi:hypothetical protein
MVILTDAENPMEIEDWETTVKKMNDLEIQTSIMCASTFLADPVSDVFVQWRGF